MAVKKPAPKKAVKGAKATVKRK